MPITQQGALNTTALVVADVYIQIVPPQFLLNGIPSNIVALVGTATWGPVNKPQVIGSPNQFKAVFGQYAARTFDMGTHANICFQQGATALSCVRVTDGTDAAATILVQSTCITFTSKYTGSYGNNTVVSVGPGSATGTWRVTVAAPGVASEQFDNLALGLTANAIWLAVASAINNGISQVRGPSQIIIATAGAGTTAPATASYTLATGADGVTTITGTVMLGVDTLPRTGMYAQRNTNASILDLCDMTDNTTWTTQNTFGLSEGMYVQLVTVNGDTIANAITTKSTAGLDSYACKLALGDWIYWNDTTNGLPQRLVSPQAFFAGKLGALSPNLSTLNQAMNSVVGTQKSLTGVPYTSADIQALALAGIDVISNPVPAGNIFGARIGHNSSSNASVHGDNYTRMINYISRTLNGGMGIYVGQMISADLMRKAALTISTFLAAMVQQKMLPLLSDGSDPYQVICDFTNNPDARTALGYMQADVQVRLGAILEFFIINLEAGQTVTVIHSTSPLAAVN